MPAKGTIPREHHVRLPSTSDRARDIARSSNPGPIAIIADEQTAGRGRQGRSWHAPIGGVWLTLLWPQRTHPAADVDPTPLIAGLAAAEAVASVCPLAQPQIKWPNDLLLNDRKLAGVLCERESGPRGGGSVRIGIGINANNAVPPDATAGRLPAISLAEHLAAPVALDQLIEAVIDRLADAMREHDATGRLAPTARERIEARLAYRGDDVVLTGAGAAISGTLNGLDDHGRLIILTNDGPRVIASGEVTLRRHHPGPT